MSELQRDKVVTFLGEANFTTENPLLLVFIKEIFQKVHLPDAHCINC